MLDPNRDSAPRSAQTAPRARRRALQALVVASALALALVVPGAGRAADNAKPSETHGFVWMQRNLQKAWNWLTQQDRIAVLWGQICRFATPIPGGYAAGMGFSIVELRADAEGRLSIASTINVGNSTHAGLSHGNRVYAAAGYEGLVTIDVSEPGHMREIDRHRGLGYALSIAMGKGYLYLAFKEHGGLAVYRMREPGPPEFVRQIAKGESYAQIVVEGDRAYAVGSEKLMIFDLADPANPALMGVLDVPYQAKPKPTDPMPRHVAIKGHYAFLSHGARGLLTADVSNPREPKLVKQWEGIDFCDWVAVAGDRAYAASEGTPVRVADVSNPLEPRWIAALDVAAAPRPPPAGVRFDDPGLVPFAFGPRGVFVLDGREPGVPPVAYSMVPKPYFHRVRVIGDQAYATAGAGGLHVFSLSDPAKPSLIGVRKTEGLARGLLVVGDQLWIADVLGWLLITRPVEGGMPEFIEAADRGGHAWDVDVVGKYVYLANSQVGFGVLEHTAQGFEVRGETFSGGYTLEVEGFGPYAYVGTVGEGVAVFRADEDPPRRVGVLKWATLGPLKIGPVATAIAVHRGVLYAGTPQGDLRAYDIEASPTDPPLLWVQHVGGTVFQIVPSQDAVWVSAGPAGVVQLAPGGSPPAIVHTYPVSGWAMGTARYRDRLLVAAGEGGLLSLPVQP
ncbi:MAG: hypothetical protein U0610_07095 [bacterium]